jgi:hypothetical protein
LADGGSSLSGSSIFSFLSAFTVLLRFEIGIAGFRARQRYLTARMKSRQKKIRPTKG